MITQLATNDFARTDRYLASRPETTMFLRSNMRLGGLVDEGRPYQGTWVGEVGADGELTGVVCHGWNGNLLLEASPESVGALAVEAVRLSGRGVAGVIGATVQVEAALTAVGLGATTPVFRSIEDLFSLSLDALRVPALLAGTTAVVRAPLAEELELLIAWRVGYEAEALAGVPSNPEGVAERLRRQLAQNTVFVLTVDDAPVATCTWNAHTEDAVQIGGVWTPPPLRGRSYGRSVVAGSLQEAVRRGCVRSILFTDQANVSARRAYEALGYRRVGDYAIVLFE